MLCIRLKPLHTEVSDVELKLLSQSLHALSVSCADVDALIHRSVLIYIRENMEQRLDAISDQINMNNTVTSVKSDTYAIPFQYVLLARKELWNC